MTDLKQAAQMALDALALNRAVTPVRNVIREISRKKRDRK